ncbi:hypothetical protein J4221_03760 [Candidatus Pacearchaeota archaeon]|nr:hypothetical protein [Candidatus Pacearchaeota archaeon]
MNKKALRFEDMGMFFLSFAVIAVAIVIGTSIFFPYEIDIRDEEARILGEKIINAIIDNGLKEEVLKDDFNILDEADIDRQILTNGELYFKLEIIKDDEVVRSFIEGNRDLEVLCDINKDNRDNPKCFREEIVVDYTIRIISASNQKGKRF